MSNCGCTSTSSTSCYSRTNVVQQVLLPITSNDCTGSSGLASGCPDDFQPFTMTGSGCIVVPNIGSTVNVEVCDASNFIVGMWVNIQGFGRYPVVGVNSATNLITIRNSCDDGSTAIAGNPDPGFQTCGALPLWLTGEDPCLDEEAFADSVKEAFEAQDEDNLWCVPEIAVATTGECVRILGLTAACDAGDCPQPDDPNCLKKVSTLRICRDTIIFDEGLAEHDETGTTCTTPVLIDEDGRLVQSPDATNFYFLPIKVDDRNSGYTDAAGLTAAMNYSIDLASVGVPECAKGVLLRCFYEMDDDDNGGIGCNTFRRGTGQPTFSDTNLILNYRGADGTVTGGDRPVTNNWSTAVMFGGGTRIIFHEYQNTNTSGNMNRIRVYIALDGYWA